MKYKRPNRKNPYWMEPELYDSVVYHCRCYPIWKKELQQLPDSSKAITYDSDKVQTSGGYDATSELALKRVEIEHKIMVIEGTAQIVSPDMWTWLLKGVTKKVTIDELIRQGMPCGRSLFIRLRQRFYYLMSKRI